MRYLELCLAGTFRDTGSLIPGISPPGSQKSFRYDHFLETVRHLCTTRRVRRILVHCEHGFSATNYGGLQAVRRELERLRNAGKELEFMAVHYGPGELYLSSVCDTRYIHPLGTFSVRGLSNEFFFFRKLLSEHKIGLEVFRRGRYKSAADTLRLDRIDHHTKEQYEELQRQRWEELSARSCEALGKPLRKLEAAMESGSLPAGEAVARGFVSGVLTLPQWRAQRVAAGEKPAKSHKAKGSYGRGKRIAVLCFEGAIVDGRSRRLPLIGQAVGDENFCGYIEKLRKSRRVVGVVLRVNSGGGSATASENIYQALERLALDKPLYVSMGAVAASGGYWISLAARRIFAERLSVTGSIGVIQVLFNVRELLRRYGVSVSTLKTHPSADFPSSLRKPSSEERKLLEQEIERVYQPFLARTATARNKPPAEIEPLAEGRVWSGYDAVRHGLVDELGGLPDAVEDMRRSLSLSKARVEFHPRIRRTLVQKLLSGSSSSPAAGHTFAADPSELLKVFASPLPVELETLLQSAVPGFGSHLLKHVAPFTLVNEHRQTK